MSKRLNPRERRKFQVPKKPAGSFCALPVGTYSPHRTSRVRTPFVRMFPNVIGSNVFVFMAEEVISAAQKTGAQRRNEVRTTQLPTTPFTNCMAFLLARHKNFCAISCCIHVAWSFWHSL